jgi:hypothetical protein
MEKDVEGSGVAEFEVLTQHLPEETVESHEISQSL